jgi:hypothetical protein
MAHQVRPETELLLGEPARGQVMTLHAPSEALSLRSPLV